MHDAQDPHFGRPGYDPETYWSARAEASGGDTYRAVCVFGSSRLENWAMERVQFWALRRLLSDAGFAGGEVMELGCGVGRVGRWFVDRGIRYSGVDISDAMLRLARDNLGPAAALHKLTSHELPFADASFDLVYAITVIHHNPHERHAAIAAEMARVTRPGGLVLVMEGVGDGSTSFNMFPRPIDGWRSLFESRGLEPVGIQPLAWGLFRSHVAYAPLRLLRRWTGRPARIRTPLDRALALPSGLLDPWLMRLLPARRASTVALTWRKP